MFIHVFLFLVLMPGFTCPLSISDAGHDKESQQHNLRIALQNDEFVLHDSLALSTDSTQLSIDAISVRSDEPCGKVSTTKLARNLHAGLLDVKFDVARSDSTVVLPRQAELFVSGLRVAARGSTQPFCKKVMLTISGAASPSLSSTHVSLTNSNVMTPTISPGQPVSPVRTYHRRPRAPLGLIGKLCAFLLLCALFYCAWHFFFCAFGEKNRFMKYLYLFIGIVSALLVMPMAVYFFVLRCEWFFALFGGLYQLR